MPFSYVVRLKAFRVSINCSKLSPIRSYLYGLQQHVQKPTHRNNHTLDVVITRINENPVHDLDVIDHLISDHKSVAFALDTQRQCLSNSYNKGNLI